MSMIFKLLALSDENDDFVREYEVEYDMSLLALHDFLAHNLSLADVEMTSFLTSDDEWNRGTEFTLIDLGDDFDNLRTMREATLGQVLHQNRDRLIYEFDKIHGRALYIELIGTYEKDPAGIYPATVKSEGVLPAEPGYVEGDFSIFDDIMDDFAEFEGDETYDEDL